MAKAERIRTPVIGNPILLPGREDLRKTRDRLIELQGQETIKPSEILGILEEVAVISPLLGCGRIGFFWPYYTLLEDESYSMFYRTAWNRGNRRFSLDLMRTTSDYWSSDAHIDWWIIKDREGVYPEVFIDNEVKLFGGPYVIRSKRNRISQTTFLPGLAVDPEIRRQGAAGALVASARATCAALGFEELVFRKILLAGYQAEIYQRMGVELYNQRKEFNFSSGARITYADGKVTTMASEEAPFKFKPDVLWLDQSA